MQDLAGPSNIQSKAYTNRQIDEVIASYVVQEEQTNFIDASENSSRGITPLEELRQNSDDFADRSRIGLEGQPQFLFKQNELRKTRSSQLQNEMSHDKYVSSQGCRDSFTVNATCRQSSGIPNSAPPLPDLLNYRLDDILAARILGVDTSSTTHVEDCTDAILREIDSNCELHEILNKRYGPLWVYCL